ncbi:MAG: DUF2232 domain-containing protein [Bacteriovoracales bacterium]|nr:DUF2232 domain-containing protein [Bacteriovoracales bacterium]
MTMIFDPKPSYHTSILRLGFLGLASVLVYFVTLTVPYLIGLTAFPLVIATAHYKRTEILSLIAICSLLVFFILKAFDNGLAIALLPLYLLACSMAIVVGEILIRKIQPSRAVLGIGLFLAVTVFLGGGTLIYQNKENVSESLKTSLVKIQDQVQKEPPKQAVEFQDHLQYMIDRAEEIVTSTPTYIFIGLFLGIWLNLYLVLRGHKTLLLKRNYPYQLGHLTHLRLPGWTAYLAIGLLALYTLPEGTVGKDLQTFAAGGTYVLGTFFFLQGFGVYLEYLHFLKIKGFLQSFLIFMTAVFANTLLAVVGILDLWFDFRRFFKNKDKDDKDKNQDQSKGKLS